MKIKSLLLMAASAGSLLALPALASSIVVNNASFETLGAPLSISVPPANWNVGPIPGWVSTFVSGYAIGQQDLGGINGNPLTSPDGTHVMAYIEGTGSISQNVAFATVGTTYTLQVDVLDRTDVPKLGLVNIQVNGLTVATAPMVGVDGSWATHTVSWTALAGDAGKTVTILLTSTGTQGDFDNVRMTATPVPEAETYAMMLAGLGVLGFVARRRQAR